MAKPKTAPQVAPGRLTKGGLVKYTFSLEPRHYDALRTEAFKRAAAVGSGKPDAGEVLREILDAWLKR